MLKKSIYGVGVNDADYVTQIREDIPSSDGKRHRKTVWRCPYYSRWSDLLYRCYSQNGLKKNPTYFRVEVCEEWLLFSNFKSWMEKQNWVGKHLDKDLLSPHNKVYSPKVCVFISRELNNFLELRGKCRGDYPIGVSFNKHANKFMAATNRGYLGLFSTPDEAHRAWQVEKLRQARLFLNLESEDKVIQGVHRIITLLENDIRYKVETKHF